jgi:hypothetical protein
VSCTRRIRHCGNGADRERALREYRIEKGAAAMRDGVVPLLNGHCHHGAASYSNIRRTTRAEDLFSGISMRCRQISRVALSLRRNKNVDLSKNDGVLNPFRINESRCEASFCIGPCDHINF